MAEQQTDIPLTTSVPATNIPSNPTVTLQQPPPSPSAMLPVADNTSAAQLHSTAPLPASGSNHSGHEEQQAVRNDSGAIAESVSNYDDGNEEEERKVPLDLVRLTLLLISGDRHVFEFEPSTKVLDVKKHLLSNWPQEWNPRRPAPKTFQQLELLYLGKFLDSSSSLESNKLEGGECYTVHLLVRDYNPKSAEDADSAETMPRCKCCIIL